MWEEIGISLAVALCAVILMTGIIVGGVQWLNTMFTGIMKGMEDDPPVHKNGRDDAEGHTD